jgi:UrcA family protein
MSLRPAVRLSGGAVNRDRNDMRSRPMKQLLSIAAVSFLVFVIVAPGASAQAPGENSLPVTYTDLDISTTAGASVILARIEHAANQVCGGQPDIRDLDARARFVACRTSAMSTAVASLHSPVVDRQYANSQDHTPDRLAQR